MRLYKVRPRKGFRMDDSRWIKWFAIPTAVLTAVLVFLTIVLARYASRLDVLTDGTDCVRNDLINLQVRRRNNPRLPQLRLYQGQYR